MQYTVQRRCMPCIPGSDQWVPEWHYISQQLAAQRCRQNVKCEHVANCCINCSSLRHAVHPADTTCITAHMHWCRWGTAHGTLGPVRHYRRSTGGLDSDVYCRTSRTVCCVTFSHKAIECCCVIGRAMGQNKHTVVSMPAMSPAWIGLLAKMIIRFQETPCHTHPQHSIPCYITLCSHLSAHNCRSKDESTTQSTLGFRLCGMVLQRHPGSNGSSGSNCDSSSCEVERYDRHWGKALTAEGVSEAFRRYADNGEFLTL